MDEHPRDVGPVRLVRMRREHDLHGSHDLAVDERREEQPAAQLHLRRVRLVHATGVLAGERAQVPDGRASLDAVGEHGGKPVEMRPSLAGVEAADLDPVRVPRRIGYGSHPSR